MAALESLDLTIAAGECVALMGPNGSGKTTAGELICGLQEPTNGWVRIAGYSMDHEKEAVAARRFLSYVPDNPYLYHDLTVADHLRLVATAHGVAGEGLEQRIDKLLRSSGVGEPSRLLSGPTLAGYAAEDGHRLRSDPPLFGAGAR